MNRQLFDFSGKKVAIIGTGVEGLAVAEFLSRAGADIELRDQDQAAESRIPTSPRLRGTGKNQASGPMRPTARRESSGARFSIRTGADYLQNLEQFDMVVRSPGVPWLLPELAKARESGVKITSQTELFLLACPCPVIGVTGTKGKSTTAALVAHILKTAGKMVRLGGNIGEPIIHWLDDLASDEYVVLELSSFQLQGLSVSPHIAVVLDIGTEHLDYHHTRDEYVEAKRSIVAHQTSNDIAVIDSDSLTAVEYAASTSASVWWFSRIHFVDKGVYVKGIAGEQWFEGRGETKESLIAPVSDVRLNGDHYFSNVAAAATVGLALEIDPEIIGDAVRSFTGLPHRMQNLGQFAGRLWIDDGYATAPDATIAALETCRDMTVVLMVGGSSKGYGFDALAQAILLNRPTAVVYIGHTGPLIMRSVARLAEQQHMLAPTFVDGGQTMHEMVKKALEVSKSGDTILFSPACASFGLFANAADRAKQFISEVRRLEGGAHATT